MYLYHLTLQAATYIPASAAGSFSRAGRHEVAAARGSSHLELFRVDTATGKVHSTNVMPLFCIIVSLAAFRLPGDERDLLVLGTDAGRMVILAFSEERRLWEKMHDEPFGRSGIRRTVPGLYVASDVGGRAVMTAAMERCKLVYILGRDPSAPAAGRTTQPAVTISSPQEAQKSNTVVFSLAALDTAYDNPLFAAIEVDASDASHATCGDEGSVGSASSSSSGGPIVRDASALTKTITYYEVDLGLNHTSRKWSEAIPRSANLLLALPGGQEGPGGVLVCGGQFVQWRRMGCTAVHSIPIPARAMPPSLGGEAAAPLTRRPTIIVNGAVVRTKGASFFCLLQTEEGDLFRLVVNCDGSKAVSGMTMQYFDTVPVASRIHALPAGFLFVACEAASHRLYQIQSLGEGAPILATSTAYDLAGGGDGHLLANMAHHGSNDARGSVELSSPDSIQREAAPFDGGMEHSLPFCPSKLSNLALVDQHANVAEMTDCRVLNLPRGRGGAAGSAKGPAEEEGEETPQLYGVQGRSHTSSLDVMRYGLEVTEVAASELPGRASGIWTIREVAGGSSGAGSMMAYIVVTFTDATTIVLKVGGESVEEETESGLSGSVTTLAVQQLGDGSIVQVHPRGFRQVLPDGRISEWKAPPSSTVVRCALNARQALLVVNGGKSLVYFEVDAAGLLVQVASATPQQGEAKVLSVAIGPVPLGRQRARHAAVGMDDLTLRILGCDPEERLVSKSIQALASPPASLRIADISSEASEEALLLGTLICDVGLENGMFARFRLDAKSGVLSEARTRYLGKDAVKLCTALLPHDEEPVRAAGGEAGAAAIDGSGLPAPGPRESEAVLAISSRSWLNFSKGGKTCMLPLFASGIIDAAPFASLQCPAGFVCICDGGHTLRILTVENVEERFSHHRIALESTPRRLHYNGETSTFAIVCADHRSYSAANMKVIEEHWRQASGAAELPRGGDANDAEVEEVTMEKCTHLAQKGQWASSLVLIDGRSVNSLQGRGDAEEVKSVYRLGDNESATCAAFVTFHNRPGILFYAVGVSRGLTVAPRAATESFILVFAVERPLSPAGASGASTGEARAVPVLRLLHKTPVDGIVSAAVSFGGRLLVSVGSVMRLYDIGQKRLLRKCQTVLPTFASCIQSQGWRVFVGDAAESVLFYLYDVDENLFKLIADDTQLHPVCAMTVLDYDTVACGDRMGNLFILRLPSNYASSADGSLFSGDGSAGAVTSGGRREHLFGASVKLERIAHFYLGDAIMSLEKTSLTFGSRDVILYTTIMGAIGVVAPFLNRDEALLFQNMEMFMRQEEAVGRLSGRDHLTFRSYYGPCKSVVDGDLCELFPLLSGDRKHFLSTGLDRSPGDILKRLQDIRLRSGI